MVAYGADGEYHHRFLFPFHRGSVYHCRIPHSRSISLSSVYCCFCQVSLVSHQHHGELSSCFHLHFFGHKGEVSSQRVLVGIEGHRSRSKVQHEVVGATDVGVRLRLSRPHQACEFAHFGRHIAELELHDAVLHLQVETGIKILDTRGRQQQIVPEVVGVAVRRLRLSSHGEGDGGVIGVHRYGMGVVNRPAVTGTGNCCSRERTGSGSIRTSIFIVVGMSHVVAAVHPHHGQAVALLPG